nr:hypothetical protein [Candidatus Frankia nodulisporulans]
MTESTVGSVPLTDVGGGVRQVGLAHLLAYPGTRLDAPVEGVGVASLYGFAAPFQRDAPFGRILAAYGGIFVAGSLLSVRCCGARWPTAADSFAIIGALICLTGRSLIMFAPRGH